MRTSADTPSVKTTWADLGLDVFSLWIDSLAVMRLRSLKIARGGAAGQQEFALMLTEKFAASYQLAMKSAAGQLGVSPAEITGNFLHYVHQRVRANKTRLS